MEGEATRTSSVPTRARQVTERVKVLRAFPLSDSSIPRACSVKRRASNALGAFEGGLGEGVAGNVARTLG